jgi:serine/threonine protein kinase
MMHNIYQGRLILSQGWVEKKTVAAALKEIQSHTTTDLCELLLKDGLIHAQQASMIRAKTAQVLGPSAPIQSVGPIDIGATGINTLLNSGAINRTKEFVDLAQITRPPTEIINPIELGSQTASSPATQAPNRPQQSSISSKLLSSLTSGGAHEKPIPKQEVKLEAGKAFGDYNLISEVSRGAMGVIFRALHRPTDRTVALKFMLDTLMDETEQVRFQREAQTLIALKHPNIVEITDYGRSGNRQFLAMQLIAGQDLDAFVKESLRLYSSPPPWRKLLPYFLHIALALEHCHQRDVLHRDIKPSNILLETETQQAMLVDFGLIKVQKKNGQEDQAALTQEHEIVGTPQFMSPEQFSPGGAFGDVGPKTDVWGLGATMYFALTGGYSFKGRTMIEIFDSVTNTAAPSARSKNSEIPQWLSQLCQDCFTKTVKERPKIGHVLIELRRGIEESKPVESAELNVSILALKGMLGLLVVLFGLYFISLANKQPSPKFESVECPELLTKKKTVLVTGQTNRGNLPIKIVTKDDTSVIGTLFVDTDQNGKFAKEIPLLQGKTLIIVSIDLENCADQIKQFIVPHDAIAPSLEFSNEVRDNKFMLKSDFHLKGKVFDANGINEFLADGRPQTISPDGTFIIRVNYKRPVNIRLSTRDKAGNKTDKTFHVMTFKDYDRIHKKN